MPNNRIGTLLDKLMNDACTPEEKEELFSLVEQIGDQPELQELLEAAWDRYERPTHPVPDATAKAMLAKILQDGKVVSMQKAQKVGWRRLAVAAAVIMPIGLGTWSLFFNRHTESRELGQTVFHNDVKAPETNRAIITLANGEKILLDSAINGHSLQQGQVKLIRQADGTLGYQQGKEKAEQEMIWNTLTNPRGSQVASVTLTDGTRVWLNAGSSLTYPVAFTGGERKVTMTGEGYFEVAHNAAMPFKVATNNTEVTVLGTRFNVMAYNDEPARKVTLVEGSVRVKQEAGAQPLARNENIVVLKPGQEASVFSSQSLQSPQIQVQTADIEQAIAWKEGLFNFKSSDITQVLRDAARWYDIEIVYEGKRPDDTFTGGIHRTATLSELLTILQMSRVKFRLEGRKLTVLSGR